MSLYLNIDEFRQYYSDAIACKTALNDIARGLNNLDAVKLIVDTYSLELTKKLIANAIIFSGKVYDDNIEEWVENTPIQQFLYESKNVLEDYVPTLLSKETLAQIAIELMELEKNKDIVTSYDGLNFEILKSNGGCYLLAHENEEKQTLYIACNNMPSDLKEACFSSDKIGEIFFRYRDALDKYNQYVKIYEKDLLVNQTLTTEYEKFKQEMLSKSPTEVFENAYKITAINDLYFNMTENMELTDRQKDYIINNPYNNTLMCIFFIWDDTDCNHNQSMLDLIDDFFKEEIQEEQIEPEFDEGEEI